MRRAAGSCPSTYSLRRSMQSRSGSSHGSRSLQRKQWMPSASWIGMSQCALGVA